MYQPYPGGSQLPEPSGTPGAPAPQSVTRAVRAMYAGAVACLIGIGVDFAAIGGLRSRIESTRLAGHPLTSAQVTAAERLSVGLFIAAGLIGAALFLWMARSSRDGKRWARTVSTVLFAIDTIGQFFGLSGLAGAPGRIWSLVVWLIGLAAIVFLWRRDSSEYFRAAQLR